MSRRVILIHGAPACGKLTTGRVLAERHPAVILHNHLTFNLAHHLFEIGDERLVGLHRALRQLMLRHALAPTPPGATPVPDLILTLVYAEPDSVASLEEIIRLVEDSGAVLLPIYLKCDDATLLTRVVAPDRAAAGKLRSRSKLKHMLETHSYPPLPHPNTRTIENEHRTPESVAAEIAGILARETPAGAQDRDLGR